MSASRPHSRDRASERSAPQIYKLLVKLICFIKIVFVVCCRCRISLRPGHENRYGANAEILMTRWHKATKI